jgi:hypothetical protein
MDYLELAVGIAVILTDANPRYVAGLQAGGEIVIFRARWIAGIFHIKHARDGEK